MAGQHVRRNRRSFSASHAVEVAGNVLLKIKSEDNLTYTELGRVIGKSKDQAERIAKGNATMDMPTFLAACDYWGERFADKVMALTGLRTAPKGSKCDTDHDGGLALAKLLPPILEAEADGKAERAELRPHEKLIRKVHQKTGHWLEMIAEPAVQAVASRIDGDRGGLLDAMEAA